MKENALTPATPEMAPEGAELALLAGEELIPALFGPDARHFWECAFQYRQCSFSYEHSWFLEIDGKSVGIAVGYDYETQKKEGRRTFWAMINCLKWTFLKQLSELRQSGALMARTREGDYYLSNLAVYPEYRGQGYGTIIMDSVEKMASESGCKRVVLDAEVVKERTLQFYRGRGYQIEETLPTLKTRNGDFKLQRMVKAI
ncbi:MAG: GNAT family N-acetyltransferase [Dehalococcoidia bacterium]